MEKIRGDIEQSKNRDEQEVIYPETKMLKRRLSWFQDLKFGVIFHYGLYAQAGIVESWQLSEKDEWARAGRAYRENIADLRMDYWQLIREFNPKKLNAKSGQNFVKKPVLGIVYSQRSIMMASIYTIHWKQSTKLEVN